MGHYNQHQQNQNQTSNNPIALEQYNSMPSADIRGGGFTIQNLITSQLARIDYLMTFGTARMGGGNMFMEELQVTTSVQRGLRTIESYLSVWLKDDPEYQELANQYKAELNRKRNNNEEINNVIASRFIILALWQDLLVSRLGNIDILPQKKISIDFD